MRQTDKLPKTKKKNINIINPDPYDVCDPEKATTCKKTRCKYYVKNGDYYRTSNILWRKEQQ